MAPDPTVWGLRAPLAGVPYSVTMTANEPLARTDYCAVQLVVNRVGQVTAVNLVWSEP